jgi:hypothetical protein
MTRNFLVVGNLILRAWENFSAQIGNSYLTAGVQDNVVDEVFLMKKEIKHLLILSCKLVCLKKKKKKEMQWRKIKGSYLEKSKDGETQS